MEPNKETMTVTLAYTPPRWDQRPAVPSGVSGIFVLQHAPRSCGVGKTASKRTKRAKVRSGSLLVCSQTGRWRELMAVVFVDADVHSVAVARSSAR
jgi:hypothetical protein